MIVLVHLVTQRCSWHCIASACKYEVIAWYYCRTYHSDSQVECTEAACWNRYGIQHYSVVLLQIVGVCCLPIKGAPQYEACSRQLTFFWVQWHITCGSNISVSPFSSQSFQGDASFCVATSSLTNTVPIGCGIVPFVLQQLVTCAIRYPFDLYAWWSKTHFLLHSLQKLGADLARNNIHIECAFKTWISSMSNIDMNIVPAWSSDESRTVHSQQSTMQYH